MLHNFPFNVIEFGVVNIYSVFKILREVNGNKNVSLTSSLAEIIIRNHKLKRDNRSVSLVSKGKPTTWE